MFSSNAEKFFAKTVPFTIKDGHNNHCRTAHLFLTVEWQEASVGLNSKELLITLTDSDDPFFLYNLQLSEEDFQNLKHNQHLLVDFSTFPQKLIEYVECCLAEENKSQPKFSLILNMEESCGTVASTAQLDVVQANTFKHLIYLSLKFLVATESAVKQYLSVCFKGLKEKNKNLQSQLCFLEKNFHEKLTQSQDDLEKKSLELESIRSHLTAELSKQEREHRQELMEERDKLMNKLREEENRFEKEKQEKEHNFKKQIQQLESRESVLDTLNKELQDKVHKQDNTIRELRTHVVSLEEELKKVKDSLWACKEQLANTQSENQEKRQYLCSQKERIEELETELRHKKQQNNKMAEQLEIFHSEKVEKEKIFEDLREQLRRKERMCLKLEEDISKANEVIGKLQFEVQSGHEKLKNWRGISSKHEHSLQDKDRVIHILKKELSDTKIDCKNKSSEIKILNESLEALREKVASMEKEFRAKDSVIKYLNRLLTDRCIIPQYVPPENLITSHPGIGDALKISSSGDHDVHKESKSEPLANVASSKPIPTRNSCPDSHNDSCSTRTQLVTKTSNAASNFTSSSCNSKSSNIISSGGNAIQSNLEIDSQALSAAFGADRISKHSTAKKQTFKTSHNSKKSGHR